MSFERALRDNPAPARVGDLALQYDAPVLIGHGPAPRRTGYLAEALWVGGLACGLGAVAALLADPGGHLALPIVLSALAACALAAAVRVHRWRRMERRIVLHFLDETLRVDEPGDLLRPVRSVRVSFDAISEVVVERDGRGRHALVAEVSRPGTGAGAPRRLVLVEDVAEEDVESLRRLWETLRAAFGLTRPGA